MNNWFRTKFEGVVRLGMCYALSSFLPLYIVNEYPKSGGTWVCQMLSDYLAIPFPRNQFPKFQSSIMHGHYLYIPRMKNVYIVMRDGRDIMVSYYYQSLFKHENLLTDTINVLGQAIHKVCNVQPDENRLREISEKYSFKNQSGRNPGDENELSFLRKGIAGDWKNYFSKEAGQVFNKFAGNELIKLGYEIDDSWIDSN